MKLKDFVLHILMIFCYIGQHKVQIANNTRPKLWRYTIRTDYTTIDARVSMFEKVIIKLLSMVQ
jgi:hypothetical protein